MYRILVPLDGSTGSEAVLPHVRRILRRRVCQVHVMRAISPLPAPFAAPDEETEALRYVRRMSFQFIHEGVDSRGIVRTGPAAAAILEAAEESRVSLICMSTQGRSGPARWVLGSVAEQVLRKSPVPVLVVRAIHPPLEGGLSRGRLEAAPFQSLLVPLDGSEPALEVLPAVRDFAATTGARIVLLNVIEEPPHNAGWVEPVRPLQAARESLEAAGFTMETDYRRGAAPEQILAAASDHASDLIALSTHGRSGPSRWVLGSVTEEVLRGSLTPLLVVRRRRVRAPREPAGQKCERTHP